MTLDGPHGSRPDDAPIEDLEDFDIGATKWFSDPLTEQGYRLLMDDVGLFQGNRQKRKPRYE